MQDLSQLDGLYGVHQARTVRNNMGAKVFFHPEDYQTAKSISDTLGIASAYSHSQTLREGEVASEGRAEQGVALFTPQELMGLGDRDILFFYKNLKPGRGIRMEFWCFPLLEQRRAIPAPPVNTLPPVAELALPGSASASASTIAWRSRGNGLRFPIDPEDFN
jgi:type IV secretory pathway TraG/TraD family ATPase VirD4